MYIRKRFKKLSIITEVTLVILVLGSFLVLISNKKDLTTLDQNAYKEREAFSTTSIDRTEETKYIAGKILDLHNINVYYGEDTKGIGKGIDAEELYDTEIIYKNIEILKQCLDEYPKDFFKEFKTGKNNYSVTIYLIDKFNNDNIALATRNTKNDFKIYISNSEDLEKVMHHELFHIIEYYLQLEYDASPVFSKWKAYNPKGYVYPNSTQNITSEYTFDETIYKDNVYFVTRYAKTTEKEDRAETFSDLMQNKAKPSYYKKGQGIYNKATYLASILQEKFSTVKEEKQEEWEKFLN